MQSGLRRTACTTLQLNVTTRCNLACHHCHVESGPKRTEAMDARVIARVIEVLAKNPQLTTLDLTGGAPEMSEHFRELVTEARKLGRRVIDRCNLTILFEPSQQDTAQFLADQGVEIIASLPCYTAENVENQRGRGVFNKSIEGLHMLCALGYGKPGNGLKLDLVYNPGGPFLPPSQAELELEYRDELSTRFDITFNNLFTITNMPIKRFAHDLERTGQVSEYMSLLVNHFNPQTVEALMCRETLSVAYDGSLFDCDFNQALAIPIGANIKSIFDLDTVDGLEGQIVATDEHCFGCTAGAGSSCGGALKENG
ncbi:MAG TPA: radical SAM/Cys-rich domain protein [Myxococcales bacterium]|nr:radical SAM/Cys-rich domain protein [Myxococcales bacterium]HIM02521.1 radical SAM/Cys-rich domain protein [Myxococcales bacterium]